MNTYLIKIKKYNYFNENNDYIIRLLVDYYYTNFSKKLCNIKFVINLKQYVSVLMVTFGKVSSSMLLDLSV